MHTIAFQVLGVVKHDLDISFFLPWPLGGSVVVYNTQICIFWGMQSTMSICPILFSQPFVSFKKDSRCLPYLSTLVSARRLFMMPRAPTPPENPFWRELELDWRGCPMAISESCFCIIARFTCRQGKRFFKNQQMRKYLQSVFGKCNQWRLCNTSINTMCWRQAHLISQVWYKMTRWCFSSP